MWERADMNRPRTIRMATLGVVPRLVPAKVRHVSRLAIAVVVALAGPSAAAQSLHEAPSGAPSTGRMAPRDEPGQPLRVSGLVVRADGTPAASPGPDAARLMQQVVWEVVSAYPKTGVPKPGSEAAADG